MGCTGRNNRILIVTLAARGTNLWAQKPRVKIQKQTGKSPYIAWPLELRSTLHRGYCPSTLTPTLITPTDAFTLLSRYLRREMHRSRVDEESTYEHHRKSQSDLREKWQVLGKRIAKNTSRRAKSFLEGQACRMFKYVSVVITT